VNSNGAETDVITESTITCPVCGTGKVETMPTDACQYFYESRLRHEASSCAGQAVIAMAGSAWHKIEAAA
jgi:hypothetical protein